MQERAIILDNTRRVHLLWPSKTEFLAAVQFRHQFLVARLILIRLIDYIMNTLTSDNELNNMNTGDASAASGSDQIDLGVGKVSTSDTTGDESLTIEPVSLSSFLEICPV